MATWRSTILLLLTCLPLPAYGAEPKHDGGAGVSLSERVQRYTGVTWAGNRGSSLAASLVLRKQWHGRTRVKVQARSLARCLRGQFERVEITASGGSFHGVPYGRVHMVTNGPFQFKLFGDQAKRGLQAPLLVAIDGDMPAPDISAALNAPEVARNLRFLKFDLPGLGEQHLKLSNARVDLVGDQVCVQSQLSTSDAEPDSAVNVRVVARPKLVREQYIELEDMRVQSADVGQAEFLGPFLEKLFNPLVDFGKFDRATHAFRVSRFEIKDGRVNYAARLLLAPKPARARVPESKPVEPAK